MPEIITAGRVLRIYLPTEGAKFTNQMLPSHRSVHPAINKLLPLPAVLVVCAWVAIKAQLADCDFLHAGQCNALADLAKR